MSKDRHNRRRCPICRVLLPVSIASKGNNPCRPCRRLMSEINDLLNDSPETLPRILRPVRLLKGR